MGIGTSIDVQAQTLGTESDQLVEQSEPEIDPTTMYWAARPAGDLLTELDKKERAYFDFIAARGFGDAWLGAYCAYYGIDPDSMSWDSHSITTDGEQGELLRFRINELRSYLRQSMTMAIGQRPAFEAVAVNDSYDTLASVEDADTAINYVYWSRYGERKERRTVEKGDLFGIGWTWVNFDTDGGEEIDVPMPLPPEAGGGPSPATKKQRTGELIVKSRAPWEVFHEPAIEDFDDHVWRGGKDRMSKYELAARYPEHRDRLLGMTNRDEFAIEAFFGFQADQVNPDELVVKHWYHNKTRALPQGRYVIYVGDLVLFDGPLPFRALPLIDYCPAEFIGTAFGYADAWDWIPLNQMLDQIVSDAATNVANTGRAVMAAEQGIEVDVEALANGMRVLPIPAGMQPPVFLQPPPLGDGAKFLYEVLGEKFASLSGLNATARGQSSANVTSGQMAALYHSIAIEVNSAKQMAVDSHRERVANLILQIMQDYMRHPLILQITGADDRKYAKEIEPGVFKSVQSVVIKTCNPMSRTQAGRVEKARMMLEIPGAVSTPEQFDELMQSGQLKPLYAAPHAKTMRVKWENEQLRKGPAVTTSPDLEAPLNLDGTPQLIETVPTVPVLAVDPHDMHMNEHIALVADPRVLQNPPVLRAVLAHVLEHYRQWRGMDPELARILQMMIPAGDMVPVPGQPGGDQAADPTPPHMPTEPKPRDSTGVQLPHAAKPPPGSQVAPQSVA